MTKETLLLTRKDFSRQVQVFLIGEKGFNTTSTIRVTMTNLLTGKRSSTHYKRVIYRVRNTTQMCFVFKGVSYYFEGSLIK